MAAQANEPLGPVQITLTCSTLPLSLAPPEDLSSRKPLCRPNRRRDNKQDPPLAGRRGRACRLQRVYRRPRRS
jgi:hypothetical protein